MRPDRTAPARERYHSSTCPPSCVCVCVCARACVRACACVCARVRACDVTFCMPMWAGGGGGGCRGTGGDKSGAAEGRESDELRRDIVPADPDEEIRMSSDTDKSVCRPE